MGPQSKERRGWERRPTQGPPCLAQGFSQIGFVDYDDTHTPVAKLTSSRAVLAVANRLGMEIHQIDIKGACLNGELNDETLYS
jgi:hypothetical protein